MHTPTTIPRRILPLAGGLLLAACSSDAVGIAMPSAADATVRTVIDHLTRHQPQVLWAALPLRTRADLRGLLQDVAARMDDEVWSGAFAVARLAIDVCRCQKQFLLDQPMVKVMAGDKLSTHYDTLLALADTLVRSELGDLARLGQLDVERFLSTTGTELMRGVSTLSALSEDDPLATLRDLQVVLASQDGDHADVILRRPQHQPRQVTLQRVQERWLPTTMVSRWQQEVQKAKERIATMGPGDPDQRQQTLAKLARARTILQQLRAAATQREFNAAAQLLLAGGSARPGR